MNYFYYFIYLIYKAFCRFKSTTSSYKIYQTSLAIEMIEFWLIFIFIIPYFFPTLSNQISANRSYLLFCIILIIIPNFIWFRNEKKWMVIFENFDNTFSHKFKMTSGLILYLVLAVCLVLTIIYKYIIPNFYR